MLRLVSSTVLWNQKVIVHRINVHVLTIDEPGYRSSDGNTGQRGSNENSANMYPDAMSHVPCPLGVPPHQFPAQQPYNAGSPPFHDPAGVPDRYPSTIGSYRKLQ